MVYLKKACLFMATAILAGCFYSEKAHIPREGEIVV